jgi:hypothetical protein
MTEEKEKTGKEEDEIISPFIKGETIDLLPINLNHVKLYAKWINYEKIRHYERNPMPHKDEKKKK